MEMGDKGTWTDLRGCVEVKIEALRQQHAVVFRRQVVQRQRAVEGLRLREGSMGKVR